MDKKLSTSKSKLKVFGDKTGSNIPGADKSMPKKAMPKTAGKK